MHWSVLYELLLLLFFKIPSVEYIWRVIIIIIIRQKMCEFCRCHSGAAAKEVPPVDEMENESADADCRQVVYFSRWLPHHYQ